MGGEPHYKRNPAEGFSFYIGDERVIPYTESIAFFVVETNNEEYMYTKHGSYESVKKHFDRDAKKIEELLGEKTYLLNFTNITDELVEEINRVIQCTGYLNTFIKKYGLINAETPMHQ